MSPACQERWDLLQATDFFPQMFKLANLLFVSLVTAWGKDGHAIVADVATAFLTPTALAQVSIILGQNMSQVATWADGIKFRRPATKPLHYVDFQNNPPEVCGFDEQRDCGDERCILTAIGNYTTQVGCTPSVESEEALKFLIHFFGDITQPLHVSNRDRGGNSAKLVYAKKQSNLHSIWDTQMVQDRISELESKDLAGYLVSEIKTGAYSSDAKSWLSNESFSSLSSLRNSKVAIEYSMDTDQYNCQKVWAGYLKDPSRDFSGDYYQDAIPVIDLQLAKGGYRLAHHINQIFEKCGESEPSSTVPGEAETTTKKRGGKRL